MTAEAKNRPGYLQELHVMGLYTAGPMSIDINDIYLENLMEKSVKQGAPLLEAVQELLEVRREYKMESHWKADVILTALFRSPDKYLPTREELNLFVRRNRIPHRTFENRLTDREEQLDRKLKLKSFKSSHHY